MAMNILSSVIRNVGESESLCVQLCMMPSVKRKLQRRLGTRKVFLTHVKVEAIELWDAILSDQLRDRWISLAHPSEEFGDTHGAGLDVL